VEKGEILLPFFFLQHYLLEVELRNTEILKFVGIQYKNNGSD